MSILFKSTFWVVTFGTTGYTLFKLFKPDDELLKKFDKESKHTDARRLTSQTIAVLKESANQNSELNKKVDELLGKGK